MVYSEMSQMPSMSLNQWILFLVDICLNWSKVAPRKNSQKYLTENVAKNHQDRDNVNK